MDLSKRDKATIQRVLRYSDVMRDRKYTLEKSGRGIQLYMSGTTSRGWFEDRTDNEYIVALKNFAIANLVRKYGESGRQRLVDTWSVG